MANDRNLYERAFAEILATQGIDYLPVRESHRSIVAGQTLKSPDFLVPDADDRLLFLDVKGRHVGHGRPTLQCWATRDDIDSLAYWERLYAPCATSLLLFLFAVDEPSQRETLSGRFANHGGQWYCCDNLTFLLLAIELADFMQEMRPRSSSWGTVALPEARFCELARPLADWISPPPVIHRFTGSPLLSPNRTRTMDQWTDHWCDAGHANEIDHDYLPLVW